MDPIMEFKGEFSFLSNFAVTPFNQAPLWHANALLFDLSGDYNWMTVEHWFQAHKAINVQEMRDIQLTLGPREAKRIGRQVEMRPEWEWRKLDVMLEGLRAKFSYTIMAERLVATHPRKLVEGNRWGDTYWGYDLRTMQGENWLGRLLALVREECRLRHA